jgi:hypothetical protein
MVSKCANPDCATPFRYFHQGKLFRLEIEIGTGKQTAADYGDRKHVRRIEFYWLCERCAGKMDLISAKGAGVKVQPRLAEGATAA